MLTLRTAVNRPLTHLELDGNFIFLDNLIGNLQDQVDSALGGITASVDSAAILLLVDSNLVADRHTARKPSLTDVTATPNFYINSLTFDDNGHVVSVGTGQVDSAVSGGTIDSAQIEQAVIDALTDSFGVPTLTSVSNIVLDAQSAVVVQSGLFRLTSATTTERNALPAQNGDLIYNTTANRIQGYQNGAWINIDDGTAG